MYVFACDAKQYIDVSHTTTIRFSRSSIGFAVNQFAILLNVAGIDILSQCGFSIAIARTRFLTAYFVFIEIVNNE